MDATRTLLGALRDGPGDADFYVESDEAIALITAHVAEQTKELRDLLTEMVKFYGPSEHYRLKGEGQRLLEKAKASLSPQEEVKGKC